MLIWIDENRKITAWNEIISEEEAKKYINAGCLWVSDLEINMPEITESQTVEMYLNEDMTIRYEIVSIVEPITDTERAILETAINTEYLVCLAEINNM